MQNTRVGINLLTCSLAHCPLHLASMKHAIRSLLGSDIGLYDWRLQIVDNGSTCPETQAFLERLQLTNERVDVEWAGENLGIARGRNLGYQILAERHEPEFVVEVHTDHIFPSAQDSHGNPLGWLRALVDYMKQPAGERAALVGASLITSGGQWYSPRPGIPYVAGHDKLQDYDLFQAEIDRMALSLRQPLRVRPGLTHPLIKRWSAMGEIGIWRDGLLHCYDPDMPGRQNFEDTEEAFRAHKAGWKVLIHFGAVVYHHYHLTRLGLTDCGADYDANSIHCQRKHGPEFIEFATATLGGWNDWAYRK